MALFKDGVQHGLALQLLEQHENNPKLAPLENAKKNGWNMLEFYPISDKPHIIQTSLWGLIPTFVEPDVHFVRSL